MTVRDALADIERRLGAAGVETPCVDAEWLVAHALGTTRTGIHEHTDVDPVALEPLVRRREAREPLAYVLGEWGFRRLVLKTDGRALVPRPETETVVERALRAIHGEQHPRVLDVGVGSGAIALAVADEHPGARVTGVDTSPEALDLARENAARLGLTVDLRLGGVEAAADGWDLVVSNPPYVRPENWDALQPEIRLWEPKGALVGAGVQAEIARVADTRRLVLEVGDGTAESLAATLAELGYERITITRDLAGTERVVEGRRA